MTTQPEIIANLMGLGFLPSQAIYLAELYGSIPAVEASVVPRLMGMGIVAAQASYLGSVFAFEEPPTDFAEISQRLTGLHFNPYQAQYLTERFQEFIIEPNSAEAQQFFDRLITLPTPERQELYATLINDLVAGGVWDLLDCLWIAGADSVTTLTNLINGGYTAAHNGVPTFTVDRGYTVLGVNNDVQTSFNPSTATKWAQNSAMVGVWQRSTAPLTAATNGPMLRADTLGNVSLGFSNDNPAYLAGAINSVGDFSGVALPSSAGWIVGNRTGATAYNFYHNDVALGALTGGISSAAPQNAAQNWFGATATTIELAAIAYGASQSAGQRTIMKNAIQAYLTGIGAV